MRKLWGRASSSNVMKVLWTLDELGLDYERIDAGGAFGKQFKAAGESGAKLALIYGESEVARGVVKIRELGDGKGMITQRGLAVARPVPTYHTQRLRELPVGHFFDVITNGYGVMFPQGARITPEDRWAIVAYVRALQKAAAPDEPLGGLDLPAPAAAPAPAPAPQAEVTVQ
jgi:hypothetical protein